MEGGQEQSRGLRVSLHIEFARGGGRGGGLRTERETEREIEREWRWWRPCCLRRFQTLVWRRILWVPRGLEVAAFRGSGTSVEVRKWLMSCVAPVVTLAKVRGKGEAEEEEGVLRRRGKRGGEGRRRVY